MPVEYQCPMRGCGQTVREPYHSVFMCYRCKMLVVPYRVDVEEMDRTVNEKQRSEPQPERKRMSKTTKKSMAILTLLAILITPLASCADQGAQQQSGTQAQQQAAPAKPVTMNDLQATDMALQIRIKALQDVKAGVEGQIREADVARARVAEQAAVLQAKDGEGKKAGETGEAVKGAEKKGKK